MDIEKSNVEMVYVCGGVGHNFLAKALINNTYTINNLDMIKEYTIAKIMVIFEDADYKILIKLKQDKLDYILKNALAGKYKTFNNAINDEQCEVDIIAIEDIIEFGNDSESKSKVKIKSWKKNKFWE